MFNKVGGCSKLGFLVTFIFLLQVPAWGESSVEISIDGESSEVQVGTETVSAPKDTYPFMSKTEGNDVFSLTVEVKNDEENADGTAKPINLYVVMDLVDGSSDTADRYWVRLEEEVEDEDVPLYTYALILDTREGSFTTVGQEKYEKEIFNFEVASSLQWQGPILFHAFLEADGVILALDMKSVFLNCDFKKALLD